MDILAFEIYFSFYKCDKLLHFLLDKRKNLNAVKILWSEKTYFVVADNM